MLRFPLGLIAILGILLPNALLAQNSPLAFEPIDAQYSSSLDKIIMISANPNELHIYDPVTDQDATVALSYVPLNLSVSPDGYRAAVMHNSAVSYVDLQSGIVEHIFSTTATTGKVVLSDGYIYVLPSYEGNLLSIDLQDGNVTTNSFFYGSGGRLDTTVNAIYGTDDGLSPDNLNKYDISSGPIQRQTGGPYHGDYPICGDVWFSPDGSRVYTACGTVFMLPQTPVWTCIT
ncbi:MAG TPA: hypothetical protein VF283_11320 [Bryobacteraceae bacterium]